MPAHAEWLVRTKLEPPPRRPDLVARPRLLERLSRAADSCRLTLVSAPAGYGKSTLLAEWARHCGRPIAWLSLDAADNELSRFLTYLVAACEQVVPGLRESPLGWLAGSLNPPAERVLPALVNAALSVPEPVALVLDDCQAIVEPSVQGAIAFVVDHLPPALRLVLASRADPPLPLARLRAQGQLAELRAPDLSFTPDESAELYARATGAALPAGEAAKLAARTEGWAAALQLLALAGRSRGDPLRHLETVGGQDRHIADYLAAEVLSQQPGPVRWFLVRTAILERLSGPLCDVVTEGAGGQQMLEDLERDNLFVLPLDDERRWYRYHQLFAEFLRGQVARLPPAEVARLHRRASAWHASQGLADEAFRHAIAGEDFQRAARVVEEHLPLKLAYGQHRVVGDWLQALPAELLSTRPLIGLYRAMLLLLGGQPGSCVRRLDEIERQVGSGDAKAAPGARVLRSRIAAVRAVLACFRDDLASAAAFAGVARRDLPEADLFFRFAVEIALGDTCRRGSQWASAVEPYMQALRIARQAPVPFIAIHPLSALGDLCVMRGQLRRAAELRRQALELVADQASRAGIAAPLIGWAYIRMGELLYEWNDLASALDHLRRGLALAELGGDVPALVLGHLAAGRASLARGDAAAAREQLERARPLVETAELPEWASQLDQLQVQLWLAEGDLAAAARWAEESRFGADAEASYRYEAARLALARVLIAQGEQGAGAVALDRALVLLTRLLRSAETAGRVAVVAEVLALQALAYRGRGQSAQALAVLERSLRLAEPEGYVRLFVDLGPSLMPLLQEARTRGFAVAYASALLAASGAELPTPARPPRPFPEVPLIEPLSERERLVLRLIAAGLSNHEIAAELVIAEGTAKRHVANIFGKLGVGSRTQAVARARELRLLV